MDKGEIARVLRRLATAYELKGDADTARATHTEAAAIRKTIQGNVSGQLGDSYESYDLMIWSALR